MLCMHAVEAKGKHGLTAPGEGDKPGEKGPKRVLGLGVWCIGLDMALVTYGSALI